MNRISSVQIFINEPLRIVNCKITKLISNYIIFETLMNIKWFHFLNGSAISGLIIEGKNVIPSKKAILIMQLLETLYSLSVGL